MKSVIDRIMAVTDAQAVANALYEVMLQWKKTDDELKQSLRNPRRRELIGRRDAYERILAAFLGVQPQSVRSILRDHYKGTA